MTSADFSEEEFYSMIKSDTKVLISCDNCNGTGTQHVLRCHASLASDCCGGCFDENECSECDNGQKEVELWTVSDEEFEVKW